MNLPDYSEWLSVEDRLAVEEKAWLEAGYHKVYAEAVDRALGRSISPVVLELGCGIGLVPQELILGRSRPCVYYGADMNDECLQMARRRNRGVVEFLKADIRRIAASHDIEEDFRIATPFLVCSFAVLKHFELIESHNLIRCILHMAPKVIFSIPISKDPRNDGTEFNHSWHDWYVVLGLIDSAGKIVERTTDLHGNEVDGDPEEIEVVLSCMDRSLA